MKSTGLSFVHPTLLLFSYLIKNTSILSHDWLNETSDVIFLLVSIFFLRPKQVSFRYRHTNSHREFVLESRKQELHTEKRVMIAAEGIP